ncbi:MAG TPA: SHOCT domain-containing protein [Solirubrobacteraceae bacterium]|jgi:Short C-terminal domain|nr:SHOCT domain-containing protein [Solirubrobacteraceae bacterium]
MPRRVLTLVLITVATLLAFLAVLALWVNRQIVNTDNFTNTSSALLQEPAIRDQMAGYLVDELYAKVDVEAEIRAALPDRADPLAGTAAGALRDFADRATRDVLARPRTQQLWEDANRAMHAELIQVLEGGGSTVSTEGGMVVLDLRELLNQTAQRVGIGARLRDRIPPDAARITVLRSDQLDTAQTAFVVLRALPWVLVGLSLGLFAAALAIARNWRRQALRACGFGLLLAGASALAARTLIGDAVVGSLAGTEAVVPPAEQAWSIMTTFLDEAAEATLFYGLLVIVCAWLAGPSRPAVWLRRILAPYIRSPWLAYSGLAVLVLLLIWWAPTPATRRPLGILIIAALLAVGLEILRHQTRREFPDATPEQAARRRREFLDRTRERARSWRAGMRQGAPAGAVVTEAQDTRLDELERLARLRDAGVLDAREFEQEKRRLLHADGASIPAG